MEFKNHILIVEDEQINRELLKIYLESHYRLMFATDVDTAIQLINTTSFGLIITDIRLSGGLDGIELLQYIRKQPNMKDIPVIAYTASETSVNQKSFAEEGFDGFIYKPALQEEILQKVATLLAESK
ncbi:MAG: response regulator [Bacteroidota bacterium]